MQKWKKEAEDMSKVLADAKESAHKMTVHDDPDTKHEGMIKRWEVGVYVEYRVIQRL